MVLIWIRGSRPGRGSDKTLSCPILHIMGLGRTEGQETEEEGGWSVGEWVTQQCRLWC